MSGSYLGNMHMPQRHRPCRPAPLFNSFVPKPHEHVYQKLTRNSRGSHAHVMYIAEGGTEGACTQTTAHHWGPGSGMGARACLGCSRSGSGAHLLISAALDGASGLLCISKASTRHSCRPDAMHVALHGECELHGIVGSIPAAMDYERARQAAEHGYIKSAHLLAL